MHYHIVALEGLHSKIPDFDVAPPHTATLTVYHNTLAHETGERVKDATIIISTTVVLDAAILDSAVTPKLKMIAVNATGTNHVDLVACRERGVAVINCPGTSIESVSEHALSLYFAARRRTVFLHNKVASTGEWKASGSLLKYLKTPDGQAPLTCQDEVCGIIGYGAIGKRVEHLAKALGMEVLIASRKGTSSTPIICSTSARVSFEEVLKRATVLFLSVPKTSETINLISSPELETMSPKTVIINISRGGIVDEAAVVSALKQGMIAGYGTDVTTIEPPNGSEDSPLLNTEAKGLNITISPHLAWAASRTLRNLERMLKENVELWIAGTPKDVIVPASCEP